MRLRGADFIDAVRSAESAHAYEVWALDRLQSLIGFDAAYFGRFGIPTESMRGFDGGVLRRTRSRWPLYVEESMPLRRAALTGEKSLVLDTSAHRAYLETTAYQDEWLLPHHLRYSLVGFMSFRRLSTGVLVLCRAGQFAGAEKDALQRILGALSVSEMAIRAAASVVTPPFAPSLTARERDVLDYVRLGYNNREIAGALGTSPLTVRNQVSGILAKLGASSRAEAVALGWREARGVRPQR